MSWNRQAAEIDELLRELRPIRIGDATCDERPVPRTREVCCRFFAEMLRRATACELVFIETVGPDEDRTDYAGGLRGVDGGRVFRRSRDGPLSDQ